MLNEIFFNSQVPYIVEGEIVSVMDKVREDDNRVLYVCTVQLQGGEPIVVSNVEQVSAFGGASDYYRRRARASADSSFTDMDDFDFESIKKRPGERVYICFINGDIQKPIIIGYQQHPAQADEFDNTTDALLAIMQYRGMRFSVDNDGQFRIVHKGLPSEGLLGGLAALTDDGQDSAFEMLDGGIIKLKDFGGSQIQLNPSAKQILISSNITEEFKDINADTGLAGLLTAIGPSGIATSEAMLIDGDAQTVTIQARSGIALTSNGTRDDIAFGDYSNVVLGELKENILKNWDVSVVGTGKLSFGVSLDIDATAALNLKSPAILAEGQIFSYKGSGVVFETKSYSITSDALISFNSGGAQVVAAGGKIAIGSNGIELFDNTVQICDALITNSATIVSTAVGPGVLSPAAVTALTLIKTNLTLIKGFLL